jgi:hypothetical protein
MTWDVLFHNEFEVEFVELPEAVQDELLARLKLPEKSGRHWADQMSIH